MLIPIKIKMSKEASGLYEKTTPSYATPLSSGFDLVAAGFDLSNQENFKVEFETSVEYLLKAVDAVNQGGKLEETPLDRDAVSCINENIEICHLGRLSSDIELAESIKKAVTAIQEKNQKDKEQGSEYYLNEGLNTHIGHVLATMILGKWKDKIQTVHIKPQGRILINTGIFVEMPKLYKVTGWKRGELLSEDPEGLTAMKTKDFISHRFFYFDQEEINVWHEENQLEEYSQDHELYELQIRPRSGLAVKKGLTVLNTPGTIDSDYRGEIKVCLYNAGREVISVSLGDKIAQGVISPVMQAYFLQETELRSTERGDKGFGSSGF